MFLTVHFLQGKKSKNKRTTTVSAILAQYSTYKNVALATLNNVWSTISCKQKPCQVMVKFYAIKMP